MSVCVSLSLSPAGLSHTDGLKKIRLLSLATLAAENPVLPYSLIATTLDIPQDDVEDWVVIAISAGVLEAKMNELKQVVIVQYVCHCTFSPSPNRERERERERESLPNSYARSVLQAMHTARF